MTIQYQEPRSKIYKPRTNHILSFVLLGVIVIAGNWLLGYNAQRGFNFFDMGSFMDGGWRIFKGQRPYVDFSYTTGPIHLYLWAIFYWIFGFGKAAILAYLILGNSAAIILTFLITRRHAPLFFAVLTAMLSAACFYLPISHPWYDQTAHLWGLFGVFAISQNIPLIDHGRAKSLAFFCGAMAMMSIMTKGNVGFLYLFCYSVFFGTIPGRKTVFVSYIFGIIVFLVLCVPLVSSINHFAEQTLFLYGKSALNRLTRFQSFFSKFSFNYYWILPLIAFLNYAINPRKSKEWQQLLVLLGGISFIAVAAVVTGSIIYKGHVFLWGVQLAFGFGLIYKMARQEQVVIWRKIVHVVSLYMLVVFAFVFTFFALREASNLTIWRSFGINPVGDYVLQSKPLKGWRCRKEVGQIIDNFSTFIESHIPSNESLLILGDLQTLYGLTGRDSYRGMPFIFGTGKWVNNLEFEAVKQTIKMNRPPWILAHQGKAVLETDRYIEGILDYLDLNEMINQNYQTVYAQGPYKIFNLSVKK